MAAFTYIEYDHYASSGASSSVQYKAPLASLMGVLNSAGSSVRKHRVIKKCTFKVPSLAIFLFLGLLASNVFSSPSENEFVSVRDTSISLTGYIKVDAIISSYSDGSLGPQSPGRDFYIPSLTPVGGESEGVQFDFHAKQSRFRLASNTSLTNGESINGVIELDFISTQGGNERVSNSYTTRIRHAYVLYKNWMVGQNWSTFMDIDALPETLDFVGSTDGVIFARQSQVRYSINGWQIALENPETTLMEEGGGVGFDTDDNSVPDFVIAYSSQHEWGYIKGAAMLRELSYDNGYIGESSGGWGVTLTGKVNLSNGDDIRFSSYTGKGIGRYGSVNVTPSAVMLANGELEAIESTGYFVGYRHLWSEKLRSSFTVSASKINNDVTLTGFSATKDTFSTRVNILYSPVSIVTFGAEYTFAKRKNEGGLEGDMNRMQLSAKYSF